MAGEKKHDMSFIKGWPWAGIRWPVKA